MPTKPDNLDTMGKATRIFMPLVIGIVVLTTALSAWQTADYLLGGGRLPDRGVAGLIGDACMVALFVVALAEWLLKSKKLNWLFLLLWLGMGAGHGYEAGGVTVLAWMAAAVVVSCGVVWFMGRNAPNFGRAGLEDEA